MKKLLNTLYIMTPDRYLSLDGENVVMRSEGEEVGRVPLHNLDGIISFGCSGASPALMGKCVEYGIDLVFLERNGKFLARAEGEINGNVLLRRQQYRIADDAAKSLEIAKNMIAGKLYNCRSVLRRFMRDHELRIDAEEFGKVEECLSSGISRCTEALSADELRGIEGDMAAAYFSVFDDMILRNRDEFRFEGRNRRPPLDKVNAMLSFSYSLVSSMCTSALEAVGLDPYVGFMHTDRPGRRSLALDLVEEFRAPLCDRFVLKLINKQMISADDFEEREDGAVLLNENGRRNFLKAWQQRKGEEIKHPFLGEKTELGMLPYAQALLLARFIRGDLDCYPAFLWKG